VQDSDLVVIGHFSLDTIHLPSRTWPLVILGGSVAYSSLVTRRLGGSVGVISKVGGDFPEAYLWWLGQEGVDLSGVDRLANEQTTRFELEYSKDFANRTLKLRNRAPPIDVCDLPCPLKAKTVYIAPIAGEISCDVVEKLSSCAEVLSLDPQGLLRSFDAAGNVGFKLQVDKNLLSLINIYKSSQDEIIALTGCSNLDSAIKAIHDFGVATVIVTLGVYGAVLSVERTVYRVPAYSSLTVVDPTGAGDVFMGSFLTEYNRERDSLWCACVGSAAASFVIEGIGPTFFGDKEEIYQRAWSLYEKGIKQ